MAIAAQVTTTATTSWATRFADSWRTDLMAVVAMLVPGVLAFGPVFGGMAGYVAAGGGVLLGLAIALLSRWRGWSWVTTTVAAVAAYLVCGGALALPRTTMGGVVPTVDTLRRLVLLTVQSWRDLLTVSLPAASFTGPAVVPLLSGIVLALLAVLAGTRTARSALAVAPCALLLVVGILWGIHTAPYAVAQGLLFAMIALVWQSARARRRDAALAIDLLGDAADSPRRPRRSFLSAAIVVGACALIAGLAAGLGAPLSRFVLRDTIEPPLDLKQFASPLTMFRSFERDLKDETLMTVTGLPAGARLRLATVDAYDGVVYNVDVASAGFHPVGTTIESETQSAAPVTTLGVTVGSYQGLWLPGGGDVRAVRFSEADSQSQAERLYYNPTTGTALTTVGVAKGAAYQIDVAL
ncbi:MAG: transglutaminaseTgpA domain-containing protein, partial [Candidatus Phosphoribacter sp.]